MPTYPHDFGVALGTEWGKELLITPLTVNIVLLFHKAHICQGGLAVGTVELFWMPGAAHGYQKRAPEEAENKQYLINSIQNGKLDISRPSHFCDCSNEVIQNSENAHAERYWWLQCFP